MTSLTPKIMTTVKKSLNYDLVFKYVCVSLQIYVSKEESSAVIYIIV